jgi:hypothetical protein
MIETKIPLGEFHVFHEEDEDDHNKKIELSWWQVW